jgi:hypothetical protein
MEIDMRQFHPPPRWGGKMKNREEWRKIVQEAKAHPEL